MSITICVLCHGDYPELARRCLGSIAALEDWSLVDEMRIGLNAVSAETGAIVANLARDCPVPVVSYMPEGGRNVGKYPLMRRMFRDPLITSSRIMWLDDDSFIKIPTASWLEQAWALANTATVLGSVYRTLELNQAHARQIAEHAWFTGRPLADDPTGLRATFVTGGWWIANTYFLCEWDYPFACLHHRGGDILLGILCRQRGGKIMHFNTGVCINADALGRESKAPRRGVSLRLDQVDLSPGGDLAHHVFDVEIRRLN